MDRSNRNFAVVHGPTFFGGCSELVCDSSFAISKVPPGASSKSVMKVGDHALLKKMRPRSMCAALKEMTTDSDNFSLEFLDPNMDNEQKATTLGMVFLLDYMFFERDQDMCHRTPKGGTEFTLCNMYCCGYLHPCKCGGGGGEGGN